MTALALSSGPVAQWIEQRSPKARARVRLTPGTLGTSADELKIAEERRTLTSELITASDARKKLIVAGPGTGKTYNFHRALETVGGGGLALTFIRALFWELERDLGDVAQVNTLHGYCKHLAYQLPLEGLSGQPDYYPALVLLMARDSELLGPGPVKSDDIEGALHRLDDSEGLISRALELGSYYDAVSHSDVVYRVWRHLDQHPDSAPEFPLIVVDEYQDFCLLETRLVDALACKNPILIAGDDDQALYGFKDASPEFIRTLAKDPAFERFDLPYCTRCTEVVVNAVNNVVRRAQDQGHLAGRIDREYLCYLPKKLPDSEAHPAIIWASCTGQTKKIPYMSDYVVQQIGQIPADDIAESQGDGYPTALILGPRHWVRPIYAAIKEKFPNAVFRPKTDLKVDVLAGYRRLASDASSRLGWRILLDAHPFQNADAAIRNALTENRELTDLVPDGYRMEHLAVAEVIGRLAGGAGLVDEDRALLECALDRPIAEIEAALGVDEEGAQPPEPETDADVPSILCTTRVGAKGLSAGYVFMVGFNDGVFPETPDAITDDEICELIVGLSRTRKECHLVSCSNSFVGKLKPSRFLNWFGVRIEERYISKAYWNE